MEYSKSMELSEAGPKSFNEFPNVHLEKLDIASLEKLTPKETVERIGTNCYSNYVEKSPGILGDFSEMSGDGGKDAFVKFYSEYVNEPDQLEKDNPEMYRFMRERIFFGMKAHQGKVPSFKGGLGVSNMKHILGNQKISDAERKEREAGSLESKAQRSSMEGYSSKASDYRSKASSLRSEAKALRREGQELIKKSKQKS